MRGKNNTSHDAIIAAVPTFVEDKKAYSHNGNSPKGGEDGGKKSYLCLPGEGGGDQDSIILGEDRGFRFPWGEPT
jgi:hypothetical protein